MNYKESVDYVYSREKFGMILGLDRIEELLQKLDNPQNKIKTIHVAGSNGKGSVCSLLTSTLKKNGIKVGTFNSPHLIDFKERIRINDEKISDERFAEITTKIKANESKQTFFETITAIAFQYFYEENVDVAIMEVGLGGRLDATNVITPELSIITNISLEHTKRLGTTIEEIAFEKSGIIKENIPTVTGADKFALPTIKRIAKGRNSKLIIAKPKKRKTSLNGKYQEKNIGIVLKALKELKSFNLDKKLIAEGLLEAYWPGRMEFIESNFLVDSAHNPAGAEELSKEIKRLKPKKVIMILGIMADKDIKKMAGFLEPVASEIILTQASIERAATVDELKKIINSNKCKAMPDIKDALEYAKLNVTEKDLIVLTGSIYTISEAYEIMGFKPFEKNN